MREEASQRLRDQTRDSDQEDSFEAVITNLCPDLPLATSAEAAQAALAVRIVSQAA
jgi:hypothetical protein